MANETIVSIKPAFEDDRGKISNILEEPIEHVAIITSKKGSIRANHYHPEHMQYVFLLKGQFESTTKDLRVDNADNEVITVNAGDLLITPPMIAHAMRFTEDSVMLNLTPGHRDSDEYEKHTKPYKLIE